MRCLAQRWFVTGCISKRTDEGPRPQHNRQVEAVSEVQEGAHVSVATPDVLAWARLVERPRHVGLLRLASVSPRHFMQGYALALRKYAAARTNLITFNYHSDDGTRQACNLAIYTSQNDSSMLATLALNKNMMQHRGNYC